MSEFDIWVNHHIQANGNKKVIKGGKKKPSTTYAKVNSKSHFKPQSL